MIWGRYLTYLKDINKVLKIYFNDVAKVFLKNDYLNKLKHLRGFLVTPLGHMQIIEIKHVT